MVFHTTRFPPTILYRTDEMVKNWANLICIFANPNTSAILRRTLIVTCSWRLRRGKIGGIWETGYKCIYIQ